MNVLVEGQDSLYLNCAAAIVGADDELAWAEDFVTSSPDYKWILGKYVEAGKANSNRQLIDVAGIEHARGNLPYAPLNLNHTQTMVGTFVATEFLAEEKAAQSQGHLEALSVFWAHRFPHEWERIEVAHANKRLYYCVDPETELLSERGWVRYDELSPGDEILTLNRETGLSEWKPLSAVHIFDTEDTKMVRMKGMTHSSLTTPNHRWWVEQRVGRHGERREWQERTSETLTMGSYIPTCANPGAPEQAVYDDALVELIAWFWTEGTIARNKSGGAQGLTIYQSQVANAPYVERIRSACEGVFGSPGRVAEGGLWYETLVDSGMVHFHLCQEAGRTLLAYAPDKVVTVDFLRNLTLEQLTLFIDISLAADGSIAAADGQIALSQRSLDRLKSFEIACVLAGRPVNTTWRADDDMWRTCVVRRADFVNPIRNANAGQGFVVENVAYSGVVWCPETENQTFFARREGSVYISMNSMESRPSEVRCVGNRGCGEEFAYAGRQSSTYCPHLNDPRKFDSEKLMLNPRFRGGALIIPPTKPGWAEATIDQIADLVKEAVDGKDRNWEDIAQILASNDELRKAALIERLAESARGC